MKEAIVHPDTSVTLHDVPVPTPSKDQVLIRVAAFGTNPKDWKYPKWKDYSHNAGDDVAGIVEAVGENVFEFKKGDRVAGFHVMGDPAGVFAEYSIVPAHTTFHIPESTSFEEAATIPLAALTAAIGLFHKLELPSPWQVKDEDTNIPLVIYGASTSVGAFAIKLASASKIHPIIAVGSSTSKFVTDEYLDPSKGDALVDYTAHKSPEALVSAIKEAITKAGVPDGRVYHAFDSVSEHGSYDKILSNVLAGAEDKSKRSLVATVLPQEGKNINGVEADMTSVGWSHSGGFAGTTFSNIWSALFGRGLQQGWFKPHPHEIIPGGLDGLEEALKKLKDGKVRAKKLVGKF
ncbi:Trans-enoyl reductase fsr4 [Cladobotryum mycophilum]|uniref:Trans-enoyl reductase fsr4 n=1 Tax=Cladobotryum mycophilum TaxID=491253 RepID=A0ABR0SNP0_9HYPO